MENKGNQENNVSSYNIASIAVVFCTHFRHWAKGFTIWKGTGQHPLPSLSTIINRITCSRGLLILWREIHWWTPVGNTISKYLCCGIMTSFTNAQHRRLFTCRNILGETLQGVPALQHTGLLLQVLPVTTSSCINCSTKWWKIRLSVFIFVSACMLLIAFCSKENRKH